MGEHEHGRPAGDALASIRRQVDSMLPQLRDEFTHGHGEDELIGIVMLTLLDKFRDPGTLSALASVTFIELARDRTEVIRMRAEIDQRQMELRALRAENDRMREQLANAKTLFIYGPGTTEIESSDQDGE